MIDLLVHALRSTEPPELRTVREMTVVLDKSNGPEPDVSVVRSEALTDVVQTGFQVADVLLAVEVVSPDSESRDRDTKPHKYAAAGIPHFWLVEMEGPDRQAVIEVFELSAETRTYVRTGTYRDQLKLSAPFDIVVDLTAVNALLSRATAR